MSKQALEVLSYALNVRNTYKWQFVTEKLGTTLHKTYVPEKCDFPCYMAKTVIQQPKDTVISKLWNVTEEMAKKWDPKMKSWTELERNENRKVCSQYNEMGALIWPRHTVFAQEKIELNGITYLVAYSVNHVKAPLDTKNYVRTNLHMSVYEYIANGSGSTTVTRIAMVDPSGSIPVWLVELFANSMVNMFNMWKE